ncbi:MAG: hypothetical protein IKI90_03340 [Treponema sp.]|nr:hypothetical protein [Treponema sp.]
MSELLPCPFCPDGKVKDYIGDREAGVVCSCGASILISHGTYVSEDEALCEGIKRWNTRHYPPEVEKAVERMKPMKVIPEKVYWAPKNRGAYFIRFLCPTCRGIANRATNREFCNNNGCGQRLDWSE